MNERDVNGNGGVDAEQARRLRLGEFLRELVRAEGRMEAAGLLGVDYRTLVKAEESGEITGRMGDALELLLLRKADDSEVGRLREAVGVLEQRLAALEGGAASHRVSGAEGDGGSDGEEGYAEAEAQDDDDKRGHEKGQPQAERGKGDDRAAPPGDGSRPRRRARLRRKDPEVVTETPAEDDAEVYGGAWSLVEEWRRLRDGHPYEGTSLWWLTTYERLLVLELAMLENHGLTLPPETQALRGFGRRGQTSWRWKALADTRTALRKRKLLRWVLPWRWREKAPEFPPGPVLVRR